MSERDGYPQGVPCWADISTSDVEGGRAFYGELFGWEWEISPDPSYGGYSTALLRGKRVAGLGGRMSDDQPVTWTTYLAVDDADKFATAVLEGGGALVAPPMDIPGEGRFALAQDSTGALFGVWQAQAHRGSQLVNEPGTVVWNELITSGLDRAMAFYSTALGVDWQDMDTGESGMVYKLLQVDGRTVGGAMAPTPEMAALPPHWTIYFEVADAEATVAKARELGAQVLSPVTPTPQGPMATLADPQGGAFAVIASGSTE